MATMTLTYYQPDGYFSGSNPAAKTVARSSVSGAPTDSYSNYKVTGWTIYYQGQVYISYGVTATFTTNGATISASMGEAQTTTNFTRSGTSLSNKILNSANTTTLTVDVSRNGGSGSGNCALFKSNIEITVTYEYAYTACSAPTSVTVSNSSPLAGESVTLSWSGAKAGDLNPIYSYEVHRATSATGTYSKLTTVKTSATSGSTTVTAPSTMGSSYYYKVKTIGTLDSTAYDSGLSSVYATVTAKTVTACSAPTTVTLSSATVDAGVAYTLSWSGAKAGTNNPILGYAIYRSTDNKTFENLQNYMTSATSGSVSITNSPTNDTTYYYQVATIGTTDGALSAFSSTASITVLTYTAVGNTTAKTAATLAEGSVKVSWTASTDGRNNPVKNYLIQYQDSADGSSWGSATNLTTVTTLEYNAALNNTRGAYRRYLITPCGTKTGFNGSVSTTAAVRTNQLPAAPQLLAPVADTTHNAQPFVRFLLANEADNQQQEVQYSIDGGDYAVLGTYVAAGGTYAAQLPEVGEGSHKVKLRVFDGMAAGAATDEFTINYSKFNWAKSPAYLTAGRMNAFATAVNTMRSYYGLDAVAFDTIAAGDIVKAAHHNALTKAQSDYVKLTGSGHTFTTVKANDLIKRKDDLEIYNAITGG